MITSAVESQSWKPSISTQYVSLSSIRNVGANDDPNRAIDWELTFTDIDDRPQVSSQVGAA